MSRLISIVGDANVYRNMTGMNVASRESMKNAQVINYVPPASFDAAFQEIRPETEVQGFNRFLYIRIHLGQLDSKTV